MMILHTVLDLFGSLGFFVRRNLTSLGLAARMFTAAIYRSTFLLKRPRLVIDQILFVGNHSFVIIAVSGLFVGFVLGLQGYYTLNRYGSEQALGLLVALSLTRELGPVITALLFAGRAGTSLTAEIGQGDCSSSLGRYYCNADLGNDLHCGRRDGRLFCRRPAHWRGLGCFLVTNAGRGRPILGYWQWPDQKSSFWCCSDFYSALSGL